MMRVASLAILLVLAATGQAHPVPRDNHDRTVAVSLTATAVQVSYRIEVDEWRVRRDLQEADEPAPGTMAQLHRAFRDYWTPILAGNLQAELDGQALVFRAGPPPRGGVPRVEDHLIYDFHFEAPWTLSPAQEHSFRLRDNNFADDDVSRLELTLEAAPGLTLHQLSAPSPALIARSKTQLQPGDRDRRRQASAAFTLTTATPVPSESPPSEEPVPAEEDEPHSLLHLLLDTRRGMAMLLLLAAGFGAVHALTPGHGKTLVAAYLVGERGTVWHALLLGVVTTLTHTAAVIVVAVLLRFFPGLVPAQVQSALGLVGGMVVAALGLWLLMRRLAGQADHIHLGDHGHHHHHHHHDHAHVSLPADQGSVRAWHLVLLGMSGGLIPCWDAIALVCLPVSAQRSGLALPLVLAFSAGLAGVLVALGVGVVYARRWTGSLWSSSAAGQRVVRLLPLASAGLITVMGVWLCYDSLHAGK